MTTVVFADLVGSTGLFERLGDAAASRFVNELVAMLSKIFEQHQGRIVKVLGDGLFVVFQLEGQAMAACIQVQNQLRQEPIYPNGAGSAVEMQIGIDTGEVVEINGDCFGDTVNSAARLADLAGAAQILTTEAFWKALIPAQRTALRSIGPMYLRGKAESSHIYRVEWHATPEGDATTIGRSMMGALHTECLELRLKDQTLTLPARGARLSMGRSLESALKVNDQRVSRTHATLEWRGGQFILGDASSYGTWVYLGNQSEAIVLRRTECCLVGSGLIVPGCARDDADAPHITFTIKAAGPRL